MPTASLRHCHTVKKKIKRERKKERKKEIKREKKRMRVRHLYTEKDRDKNKNKTLQPYIAFLRLKKYALRGGEKTYFA